MKYILAIDQSTSGTKAALLDERGAIARKVALAHRQYYPAPGHVEHDAQEIFENTLSAISAVAEDIAPRDIAGIGIANQRETTVIWDSGTGEPVCPAVVWQDVRGEYLTRRMAGEYGAEVFERTGLALSPYYPAAKVAAVLDANPDLRRRARAGELRLGTVDSYLLYRLTNGKVHATDVSNAGRTQLMDLRMLKWDEDLLDIFEIPESMMPRSILHSDAFFGETACEGIARGVAVRAMMGDSHASLFGHGCHAAGMVKTSYGTGSSIMLNVGENPVWSGHGLSASVGFGYRGAVSYVLEGNITCSADTLIWLRDGLQLIGDLAEVEPLASEVPDTQGVCLVPAFSGLGAPYFDSEARAALCGMNRGTTKAHVVRAALESIAHQNADVLDAMAMDMGKRMEVLHADGGGSVNRLLMQMQADFVPVKLRCSAEKDLTALGVGHMAGLAAGVYQDFEPLAGQKAVAEYLPAMPEDERRLHRERWADAVGRTRGPYGRTGNGC